MQLWAIQDALKAALESGADAIPVSFGFPKTLEKRHLWIQGSASGEPEYELTGRLPSKDVCRLTVSGYLQYAGTPLEARDELQTLWDLVTEAVHTLEPGSTQMVKFGDWRIEDGTSTEGYAEFGFDRVIVCEDWE